MKVIKLGGSLLSSGGLRDCLSKIIQRYDNQVVIVAGGGGFADQVRHAQQTFQFNDYCAHAMALLAMQQTAWLIKGLEPRFVLADSVDLIKQLAVSHVVLWLPDLNELDNAGVPATWDVTSDSLAAWLAKALNAEELLLVKSADIASSSDGAIAKSGNDHEYDGLSRIPHTPCRLLTDIADLSLKELQERGIVDAAFSDMARGLSVRVLNYQAL